MNNKTLVKACYFFLYLSCKCSNEIDEYMSKEEADIYYEDSHAWWGLHKSIEDVLIF